jgi:hypothetical protein
MHPLHLGTQTQANLRYYGGARKTAYQLDLFVHKYALPTSTALHKRGTEFSAANKWLKKMLNGGHMLDVLEMATLRRAGASFKFWAQGLRIHSEMVGLPHCPLFLRHLASSC